VKSKKGALTMQTGLFKRSLAIASVAIGTWMGALGTAQSQTAPDPWTTLLKDIAENHPDFAERALDVVLEGFSFLSNSTANELAKLEAEFQKLLADSLKEMQKELEKEIDKMIRDQLAELLLPEPPFIVDTEPEVIVIPPEYFRSEVQIGSFPQVLKKKRPIKMRAIRPIPSGLEFSLDEPIDLQDRNGVDLFQLRSFTIQIQQVAEPSGLALALVGLAGCGVLRRRYRASAPSA
jgi:hypothetical protein